MEARAILLTSLVLALWTSTTTGEEDYCVGKDDGPYCKHCWQPIECTGDVSTLYLPCGDGMACTVAVGTSFCTSHTGTDCACAAAGDQCDAYNPGYIEHCFSSGPFLVEACPPNAPICYNDMCGVHSVCEKEGWNLTPDCTGAYFCEIDGVIDYGIDCADDEYVNSEFECAPAPPPACDGSCTGKCPNPVDCSKFFVCDGAAVIGEGGCLEGSFFDIYVKDCVVGDPHTCTFLDGCDFDVGLGGTSTTTAGPTTTTAGPTTTTAGPTTTTAGPSTTTAGPTTTTAGPTTTTAGPTTTTAGPTTTTAGPTTTTAGPTTTTAGPTTTSAGPTTTTDGPTTTTVKTTTTGITTTTDGGEYTAPPPETCNSSTVGSKYPYGPCSKQYHVCVELVDGQYQYVVATCLGNSYYDPDPANPYCMLPEHIDTCQ